jgi:cytochrome c-type biogenesis protein CcmH
MASALGMRPLLILLVAMLAGACAVAAPATPVADDPVIEARMQRIAAELRCLVCQNQTIADSQSGLAQDLRQETRELIAKGASDDQIRDYMTARYGDFVLYRPPMKATTVLLWAAPVLLLVAGLLALAWALRRRSRLPPGEFDPDDDVGPQDAVR